MRITSENLLILTRQNPSTDTNEMLVGTKKRGLFAGKTVFPGGKAEGAKSQRAEAKRELEEETGISIDERLLKCVGKLLISDYRPGNERFGNVFLYKAEVNPHEQFHETDELTPYWTEVSTDVIKKMPIDVGLWLPRLITHEEDYSITHIHYDETGNLNIANKQPDRAHTPGAVHATAYIPASMD
jgi:8-oxo-dGTP pyrophosphatase MutT (NUDIX family)